MGDNFTIDERFAAILHERPPIAAFLDENPLTATPERMISRWRSHNDVYVLQTAAGKKVLKCINQPSWKDEIDCQRKLSEVYPGFVPAISAQDGPAFIMNFVYATPLRLLLKEPAEKAIPLLQEAGRRLREIYGSGIREEKGNATSQLAYNDKYRKYGDNKEVDRLEAALPSWKKPLTGYPTWKFHNDLNSMNFCVSPNGEPFGIDTRADVQGIRDIAKDLGRAVASAVCAAFDSHYTPEQAEAVGLAITNPWNDVNSGLEQRTAFYAGQSGLSFARWDTDRFVGPSLFPIGVDMLSREPSSYRGLPDVILALVEGYATHARDKAV